MIKTKLINSEALSDRIRSFRDSRGFSREDLARELGVTPITLYRWETGSTRPSPLAVEKLRAMGFGDVAQEETNASTVSRLKVGSPKSEMLESAAALRDEGQILLKTKKGSLRVLAAPFVRNGPPDQGEFHRRLLDLQVTSNIPSKVLSRRL